MKVYTRKALLLFLDVLLVSLAVYTALYFRFDGAIPAQYTTIFLHSIIFLVAFKITIFHLMGLYSSLWRYAGIDELIKIFFAASIGTVFDYAYGIYFDSMLPRSIYPISFALIFLFIGGSRLSYRIFRRVKVITNIKPSETRKKIMVIGAGDAGSMVIKELHDHHELNSLPVAIIDDDTWKHKSRIHGVPVVGGRNHIKDTAENYNIDEIIIALPSAKKTEIAQIIKQCKSTKCKLKTLPGVFEIIDNRVSINQVRDVSIEDLLVRDEVTLNTDEISGYLKNEIVLVTGGGGSIGSELVRQIAKYSPSKILVFDIYENSAYELQNEILRKHKNKFGFEVIIGSVRDKKRLEDVFDKYRPGVVFHAAAHKHVPLMETSPCEAIKNNVFGTLNVAQCAHKFNANKFVLISTDKAVNPTNVMGTTKRIAEMIIQSLDKQSNTEFVAVRFGNVLGSNGSVIPLFKSQIANGGPVTVTHPEVTRYFMTIPEASRLVIQAGSMAKGGEIFILDMGMPVKIVDLARDLIKLSGYEPDVDMKIEFTGLRPGEKLYEELLLKEEGIKGTRHDNIFVGKPLDLSYNEVILCLKSLENSLHDDDLLRENLAKIVPTYTYKSEKSKKKSFAGVSELGFVGLME